MHHSTTEPNIQDISVKSLHMHQELELQSRVQSFISTNFAFATEVIEASTQSLMTLLGLESWVLTKVWSFNAGLGNRNYFRAADA